MVGELGEFFEDVTCGRRLQIEAVFFRHWRLHTGLTAPCYN